jgi:phosphoglycolate phosphatase
MTLPTLIFDLDGTLTDPRLGIIRCLLHALAESGVDAPAGDLTRFIGPPLLDTLTTLTGSVERGEAALAAYRREYAAGGLLENELYPGIEAALELIAGRAPALFVATSKPRVFAERIVAHFGLDAHFASVYGPELTGERSNKADLLRHVLDRERLRPADVVMIGDREHDVIAARANGVRSIGVTWGFGSREELERAGAHVIVDSPEELAAWYAAIIGRG